MKYRVENNLHLFEFHDAAVSHVMLTSDTLTMTVSALNIHKHTSHNPSDYDMCIESAVVTLHGLHVLDYSPQDSACKSFTDEIKNGFRFYYFSKEEGTEQPVYTLEGCGTTLFFSAQISFSSVTVEWDTYTSKAWYELVHTYKHDLCLNTAGTEIVVPLTIYYHEECAANKAFVTVALEVSGRTFGGQGVHAEQAFADLAKQLPAQTYIKCCLTCRHGNFCPIGDQENELFCTQDAIITQKSDLYFYTEDEAERAKRSRKLAAVCTDYCAQSADFYTYNDYLDYLRK